MIRSFCLERFSVADLLTCAETLKSTCSNASSMEEAATKVVNTLYNSLVDEKGSRACVLVRLFTTMRYADLSLLLRGYARARLNTISPTPDMKCLTLLGTAGIKPEWNSRAASVSHQAIPLPSPEIIKESPMIAQLLLQFGLDIGAFLTQSPDLLLSQKRTYNVFFVPEALGSPYVPAQQFFVIPMGIRSVIGFGGLLPSGNLFAVIMFLRVAVTLDVADLFKSLALTVRGILLPYDQKRIFL